MDVAEKYFTHPDAMRGSTRRKQNGLMHQQVTAFDAMLKVIDDRHDTAAIYHVLNSVVPYNRTILSLDEFYERVDKWFENHERSDSDLTISDNFVIFQQNIQLLKQLKATFDDRIYSVLFEFYYEMVMEEIPQAIHHLDMGRKMAGEVRGSNFLTMSNVEDYSLLHETMPAQRLVDISEECDKLFTIIYQLQDVNVRWSSLLRSHEVDVALFDSESIDNVKPFPNYMRFEAVLRLIPDALQKARNASDLAKKWWYSAEMIRRRLRGQKLREKLKTPSRQSSAQDVQREEQSQTHDEIDYVKTPEELHSPVQVEERLNDEEIDKMEADEETEAPRRAMHNPIEQEPPHSHKHIDYPVVRERLERYLQELSTSIALKQMDLAAENNETDFIKRRKERAMRLQGNIERASVAMEAMHGELVGYRRTKEHLIRQMDATADPAERRRLMEKMKLVEEKVQDIQELTRVIDYRHKLTARDLKLELDLKESLESYQYEVKERAEKLRAAIREEETERDELIKELGLLRLRAGMDMMGQHGGPLDVAPKAPTTSGVPWFDDYVQSWREEFRRETQPTGRKVSKSSPYVKRERKADNVISESQRPRAEDQPINGILSPDSLKHRIYQSRDSGQKAQGYLQRRKVPYGTNLPPLKADSETSLSRMSTYEFINRKKSDVHIPEATQSSPYHTPATYTIPSSPKKRQIRRERPVHSPMPSDGVRESLDQDGDELDNRHATDLSGNIGEWNGVDRPYEDREEMMFRRSRSLESPQKKHHTRQGDVRLKHGKMRNGHHASLRRNNSENQHYVPVRQNSMHSPRDVAGSKYLAPGKSFESPADRHYNKPTRQESMHSPKDRKRNGHVAPIRRYGSPADFENQHQIAGNARPSRDRERNGHAPQVRRVEPPRQRDNNVRFEGGSLVPQIRNQQQYPRMYDPKRESYEDIRNGVHDHVGNIRRQGVTNGKAAAHARKGVPKQRDHPSIPWSKKNQHIRSTPPSRIPVRTKSK